MAEDEGSPAWLPAGWKMEVRTRASGTRAGQKDRYYSTPEINHRFRSKREIFHYLELKGRGNVSMESVRTRTPAKATDDKKPLVEKLEKLPEWLPKGWSAEIKIRKGGTRSGARFKCYIDPSTGRKFYSKNQVFNYLRIGNTRNKTSAPKKRRTNELSEENSPVEAKRRDVPASSTKRSLFTAQSSGADQSMLHQTDAGCPGPSDQCGRYAQPIYVAPLNVKRIEDALSKQSPELKEVKVSVGSKAKNDGLAAVPVVLKDEKQFAGGISVESGCKYQKEERESLGLMDSIVKEKGLPPRVEESKPLENKGLPEFGQQQQQGDVLPEPADSKPSNNREGKCQPGTAKGFRRKVQARKTTALPKRTSKRLAGLAAVVDPNLADPESARRLAAKQRSTQSNSCTPKDFSTGASAASASVWASGELDQLKANQQAYSCVSSARPEGPELENKHTKEVGSTSACEAEKRTNDKAHSSEAFPFSDSWLDPCLEFAFKTLTDAIPVDGMLENQLLPTGSAKAAMAKQR